jgi:hypothetical protein
LKLSALRHWGRAVGKAKWILGLLFPVALGGCGTYVPDLQEFPRNNYAGSVLLVRAITRSVECELKKAVTGVVNADINNARGRASHRAYTDFLNDWGAEVTFTFTIVERTGLNPAGVWMPVSPLTSVFTLSGDANLSSEATRIEKLNFFYTVKDLYLRPGQACDASGEDPTGSFLIRNDLKIGEVLDSRILPASTGIASTPNSNDTSSGDKNVLSQEISFHVITSGDLTPTWVLARGTINATGNFLSGSRDRTHDLLVTFGPLDKPHGGRSLISIAEQTHFSSQISGGISTNLNSTRLRR